MYYKNAQRITTKTFKQKINHLTITNPNSNNNNNNHSNTLYKSHQKITTLQLIT